MRMIWRIRADEKSGVRLALLGWVDLVSELVRAGSGLVPTVSGMVN